MGLVLKINDRFLNRQVEFFNQFELNLVHDAVGSEFSFNFWFDPENTEHKELTTPLHYHEATVFFNDILILTGFITNNSFRQSAVPTLTSFGGYSLPGVLADCEIPTSSYPLQSNGLSLEQIANKLTSAFRIKMAIDPAVLSKMQKSFDTSSASEDSSVADYLAELASQKDIIISHNAKGELLFTEAKLKQDPILTFDLTDGAPVGTDFNFNVNGQGMHKFITVQKQASTEGGNAGQQRIRNPLVAGNVIREKVKSQSSGDDNDTISAVRRALGNEIRAVALSITTDRWIIDGEMITPNNTIEITAPKLFLYNKTTFFIESVKLSGDESKTVAILNCVLPEVYNGETPVNPFRDINLHPTAT